MSIVQTNPSKKPRNRKPQDTELSLYGRALLEREISLHITNVGKHLFQTIEKYIQKNYEGHCSVEGFIKENTSKIINYSSGNLNGENVQITVIFECQLCHPVEGMKINCTATNITKAGIRAESIESPSPVIVFILRDHNYENEYFNSIKEGYSIQVKVIGQRFELNDKHISIVAK